MLVRVASKRSSRAASPAALAELRPYDVLPRLQALPAIQRIAAIATNGSVRHADRT